MTEEKYPNVIDEYKSKKVENKNLCDEEPFKIGITTSKLNFFQLYMIGLCNQEFTNRLVAQQITDKPLFERLNNIFEHELFNPSLFIPELKKHQFEIAYPKLIEFYNLDEKDNKRQLIIQNLQNHGILEFNDRIFYSKGCSPNFNFPYKVLVQKKYNFSNEMLQRISGKNDFNSDICLKKINYKITQKLHEYYQLSFIIGLKDEFPTMIIFKNDNVYKISGNKTELLIDINDITQIIDTLYILHYFKK